MVFSEYLNTLFCTRAYKPHFAELEGVVAPFGNRSGCRRPAIPSPPLSIIKRIDVYVIFMRVFMHIYMLLRPKCCL